jgi:hypothetical protein
MIIDMKLLVIVAPLTTISYFIATLMHSNIIVFKILNSIEHGRLRFRSPTIFD